MKHWTDEPTDTDETFVLLPAVAFALVIWIFVLAGFALGYWWGGR